MYFVVDGGRVQQVWYDVCENFRLMNPYSKSGQLRLKVEGGRERPNISYYDSAAVGGGGRERKDGELHPSCIIYPPCQEAAT